MDFLILGVLCMISAASSHVHTAVETEMFSIPISPNLFNWTYQEFDQQYRFHASLVGKPELPTWLRYIYSRRHHSGFIFGTPPRGVQQPITLEIIGLNRQDYETRRVQITLTVLPKERMAKHEVELKIDNLNVEDLLDEHRMTRLKDILRTKLWTESSQDLYATFLASAIDMGARLPLKPEDGEGLVVRLGSASPFSAELQRLREEVRPLSRLPRCPRDYKRTTVERLFRDAGLTLDWCSFELYNTIYNSRLTQLVEYLTPDQPPESDQDRLCPWTSCDDSKEKWEGQRNDPLFDPRDVWTAPSRHDLPQRSMAKTLTAAVAVPVVLLLICIATLTAVVCFHYAAISDPVSDNFLEQIFHICIDFRYRRGHKSGKVELCRYNTEQNTDQTHLADNTSGKSVGVSPNNSLARPYSPKSTTNLAGNYNRPQPPPYMGSNTNSLHHRKSTIDKTTPSTSGHTPEHRTLALEESLKLLNEANISNPVVKLLDNGTDFNIPLLKEPIVDLSNGSDDYVPIKPEQTGYVSIKPDGTGYVPMNPDLDDIEVPDLAKFGIGAAI